MTSDHIRTLLRSRATQDRIRAVESLSAESPDHIPLLLDALRDKSHYVCARAAAKLAESPPEEAARTLLDRLNELTAGGAKADPGCHIRLYLVIAIGKLGYHPAADALRVGLKTVQIEPVAGVPTDTAVALRGNCALALSQIWTQDAARDIGILLFDQGTGLPHHTATARKAAAQALGRLGDPSALVPLAIRLTWPEHELPDVLADCMEAVVALEDPRAMELLEPYLESRDSGLAAHAALMIARLQHPRAPKLLNDLATRLYGNALKAVALALASMRTDEAMAALHSLARHTRDDVRLAAVEALSGASDDSTRKLLDSLAREDDSPAVRAAAERARAR